MTRGQAMAPLFLILSDYGDKHTHWEKIVVCHEISKKFRFKEGDDSSIFSSLM